MVKRIVNAILLAAFKIKLGFKMFKIKFPHIKRWIISILCLAIVCGGLAFAFLRPTAAYYYIDYNGNRGVATKCYEQGENLMCERSYNGKVLVVEYWRGE
jgi:hypothetical protein